jgi:hypothetical protein
MQFRLIFLHPEQNGDRIQTATLEQHPGQDILIGSGQFTRRCRMGSSRVPVQGPRHHLREREVALS